jgi:hypothetical protein
MELQTVRGEGGPWWLVLWTRLCERKLFLPFNECPNQAQKPLDTPHDAIGVDIGTWIWALQTTAGHAEHAHLHSMEPGVSALCVQLDIAWLRRISVAYSIVGSSGSTQEPRRRIRDAFSFPLKYS